MASAQDPSESELPWTKYLDWREDDDDTIEVFGRKIKSGLTGKNLRSSGRRTHEILQAGEVDALELFKRAWDEGEEKYNLPLAQYVPWGSAYIEGKEAYDVAKAAEVYKTADPESYEYREAAKVLAGELESMLERQTGGAQLLDLVLSLPKYAGEFGVGRAAVGAQSLSRAAVAKAMRELMEEAGQDKARKSIVGRFIKGQAWKDSAKILPAMELMPELTRAVGGHGGRTSGGIYRRMVDWEKNPDGTLKGFDRNELGEMELSLDYTMDSFIEAAPFGIADRYIEVLSEGMGGSLGMQYAKGAVSRAAKRVPGLLRLKSWQHQVVGDFMQRHKKLSTFADVSNRILKQGGWDGMWEEWLEERFGSNLRTLTLVGEDEFLLQWKDGREELVNWDRITPDWEQWAIELTGLAIPGATTRVADVALNTQDYGFKRKMEEVISFTGEDYIPHSADEGIHLEDRPAFAEENGRQPLSDMELLEWIETKYQEEVSQLSSAADGQLEDDFDPTAEEQPAEEEDLPTQEEVDADAQDLEEEIKWRTEELEEQERSAVDELEDYLEENYPDVDNRDQGTIADLIESNRDEELRDLAVNTLNYPDIRGEVVEVEEPAEEVQANLGRIEQELAEITGKEVTARQVEAPTRRHERVAKAAEERYGVPIGFFDLEVDGAPSGRLGGAYVAKGPNGRPMVMLNQRLHATANSEQMASTILHEIWHDRWKNSPAALKKFLEVARDIDPERVAAIEQEVRDRYKDAGYSDEQIEDEVGAHLVEQLVAVKAILDRKRGDGRAFIVDVAYRNRSKATAVLDGFKSLVGLFGGEARTSYQKRLKKLQDIVGTLAPAQDRGEGQAPVADTREAAQLALAFDQLFEVATLGMRKAERKQAQEEQELSDADDVLDQLGDLEREEQDLELADELAREEEPKLSEAARMSALMDDITGATAMEEGRRKEREASIRKRLEAETPTDQAEKVDQAIRMRSSEGLSEVDYLEKHPRLSLGKNSRGQTANGQRSVESLARNLKALRDFGPDRVEGRPISEEQYELAAKLYQELRSEADKRLGDRYIAALTEIVPPAAEEQAPVDAAPRDLAQEKLRLQRQIREAEDAPMSAEELEELDRRETLIDNRVLKGELSKSAGETEKRQLRKKVPAELTDALRDVEAEQSRGQERMDAERRLLLKRKAEHEDFYVKARKKINSLTRKKPLKNPGAAISFIADMVELLETVEVGKRTGQTEQTAKEAQDLANMLLKEAERRLSTKHFAQLQDMIARHRSEQETRARTAEATDRIGRGEAEEGDTQILMAGIDAELKRHRETKPYVYIVTCGQAKRSVQSKAADMYTSATFTLSKKLATKRTDQWMILSGKHGLLDPDQLIDPYNETLKKGQALQKALSDPNSRESQIAKSVGEQAWSRFGPDVNFVILGPRHYVTVFTHGLKQAKDAYNRSRSAGEEVISGHHPVLYGLERDNVQTPLSGKTIIATNKWLKQEVSSKKTGPKKKPKKPRARGSAANPWTVGGHHYEAAMEKGEIDIITWMQANDIKLNAYFFNSLWDAYKDSRGRHGGKGSGFLPKLFDAPLDATPGKIKTEWDQTGLSPDALIDHLRGTRWDSYLPVQDLNRPDEGFDIEELLVEAWSSPGSVLPKEQEEQKIEEMTEEYEDTQLAGWLFHVQNLLDDQASGAITLDEMDGLMEDEYRDALLHWLENPDDLNLSEEQKAQAKLIKSHPPELQVPAELRKRETGQRLITGEVETEEVTGERPGIDVFPKQASTEIGMFDEQGGLFEEQAKERDQGTAAADTYHRDTLGESGVAAYDRFVEMIELGEGREQEAKEIADQIGREALEEARKEGLRRRDLEEPPFALRRDISKPYGEIGVAPPNTLAFEREQYGTGSVHPREFSDRLYRETSLSEVLRLLAGGDYVPFGIPRFYTSNNPDLALGQGANQGAVIALDTNLLPGRDADGRGGVHAYVEMKKPGDAFQAEQGNYEIVLRAQSTALSPGIVHVLIKNDGTSDRVTQARLRQRLDRLKAEGWSESQTDEGVLYSKSAAPSTLASDTPPPTFALRQETVYRGELPAELPVLPGTADTPAPIAIEGYHGSTNPVSGEFEPERIGSASGDSGYLGAGFYFYLKEDAARDWIMGRGDITKRVLRLEMPLDFDKLMATKINWRTIETGSPDFRQQYRAENEQGERDRYARAKQKYREDLLKLGNSQEEIEAKVEELYNDDLLEARLDKIFDTRPFKPIVKEDYDRPPTDSKMFPASGLLNYSLYQEAKYTYHRAWQRHFNDPFMREYGGNMGEGARYAGLMAVLRDYEFDGVVARGTGKSLDPFPRTEIMVRTPEQIDPVDVQTPTLFALRSEHTADPDRSPWVSKVARILDTPGLPKFFPNYQQIERMLRKKGVKEVELTQLNLEVEFGDRTRIPIEEVRGVVDVKSLKLEEIEGYFGMIELGREDFWLPGGFALYESNGQSGPFNDDRGSIAIRMSSDRHGIVRPQAAFDHGDYDNMLGWVRYDVREVNGEEVMFIHELQSDWYQKGQRTGFQAGLKGEDVSLESMGWEFFHDQTWHTGGPGMWSARKGNVKSKEHAHKSQVEAEIRQSLEPRGPWSTNDSWRRRILDRMVYEAAKRGHTKLAWATGASVVDLWSSHVEWDQSSFNKVQIGKGPNPMLEFSGDGAPAGDFARVRMTVLRPGEWVTKRELAGPQGKKQYSLEELVGPKVSKQITQAHKMNDKEVAVSGAVHGVGVLQHYDQGMVKAAKELKLDYALDIVDSPKKAYDVFNADLEIPGGDFLNPQVMPAHVVTIPDHILKDRKENGVLSYALRPDRTQEVQETLFRRFTIPRQGWKERQVGNWQDYFSRVRQVQDLIAEQGGEDAAINDEIDTYLAEERFSGKVMEIHRRMEEEYIKPLRKILGELELTDEQKETAANPEQLLDSLLSQADQEGWSRKELRDELHANGFSKVVESRVEDSILQSGPKAFIPKINVSRNMIRRGGMAYKYEFDKYASNLDDLGWYMYALHADERNAEMHRRYPNLYADPVISENNPVPTTGPAGSGMQHVEAERILDRVDSFDNERREAFVEAAEIIKKMNAESLERRVETGLTAAKTAEHWRTLYPNYVPLRSDVMDESRDKALSGGYDIRGEDLKMAKGRKSLAHNPVIFSIVQFQTTAVRAEKNRVAQTFLRFVRENPDPQQWEEIKNKRGSVEDWQRGPVSGELVDEVRKRASEEGWSPERLQAVLKELPPIQTASQKAESLKKKQDIAVKEGGQEYRIAVRDTALLDAMKRMGELETAEWVQTWLGNPTRMLARMNTALDPEFILRNLFRDLQTAGINMQEFKEAEQKGFTRKVLKDAKNGVSGTWSQLRFERLEEWERDKQLQALQKKDPEELTPEEAKQLQEGKDKLKWARAFEDFRAEGGKTAVWTTNDFKRAHRTIREDMARGDEHNQKRINKAFRNIGAFVDNANDSIENGIRVSVFYNARLSKAEGGLGLTSARAASLAKNITVNFNRKGRYGSLLNSAYMFANAGIQGNARIIKAYKNSARVRRWVNYAMTTGFFLDLINRFLGGDDEDGIPRWDKIPEYEKDRNLILMLNFLGIDEPIKIPMPWGYNLPVTAGRQLASCLPRAIMGAGKPAAEAAKDLFVATVENFNPLGSGTLMQTIAPTLADPFVMSAENKRWTGAPIRPEQDQYGTYARPRNQLFWGNVNPVAKTAADAWNQFLGGSDYRPGRIGGVDVSVSPEDIEEWVEFATGGLGRFAMRGINFIDKAFGEEELLTRDVPFVRSFMGAGMPERSTSSMFYEKRGELYKLRDELIETYALEPEKASKLEKQYAPFVDLIPQMEAYDKELKRMRKIAKDAGIQKGSADYRAYTSEQDFLKKSFLREYFTASEGNLWWQY